MPNLKIIYTKHLEERLILRGIERELPTKIFQQSKERFFDKETGHFIATLTVPLYNDFKEVMVAYTFTSQAVKLITIHPLKAGQKANRLATGRWRKII